MCGISGVIPGSSQPVRNEAGKLAVIPNASIPLSLLHRIAAAQLIFCPSMIRWASKRWPGPTRNNSLFGFQLLLRDECRRNLQQRHSVSEVPDAMLEEYDVERDCCERDLQSFSKK
jgi:hypothetical protein